MELRYDSESDALYIRLNDERIADTEETDPGCMVDYDDQHQVVGIEILRASKRILSLPLPSPARKVRRPVGPNKTGETPNLNTVN